MHEASGMEPGADRPPRPPLAVIRPFTIRIFNPFSRLFVRWLPGFGILSYRGRKSGRRYRTPMNAFRDGEDWIFALTYGSDVQWVKNVLVSGEAELLVRRTTYRLTKPELFVDRTRHLMPVGIRQILGLMRVSEFMRMRPASQDAAG